MINHGLSNVSSLFRGDKEIILVYRGDTLVYKKKTIPVAARFNLFVSYNTMSRFNGSSASVQVDGTKSIDNKE